MKIKEVFLGENFIKFFNSNNDFLIKRNDFNSIEIFSEVKTEFGYIDIIIKNDLKIFSIELKTSFNIKVIHQAYLNLKYSNFSYIVVPKKFFNKMDRFLIKICKDFNIGIIFYDKNMNFECFHKIFLENEQIKKLKLVEGQKNNSPGTNGSKITPFKDTINRLEIEIKNGNNDLNEICKNESFHYVNGKSALNSLRKALKQGLLEGYTLDKDNKTIISFKLK
jgi:hypothetical protein